MSEPLYIWVNRWPEFQSYETKRGKPWVPPWIKDHTKQLSDDRYRDLTAAERGLLHDIRMEFARTQYDLNSTPSRLSARFGYKVYTRQLQRLNDAGFITICSRTVLEQFVSAFRNGSHPEVEVEVEQEQPSFLPPVANYAEDGRPENLIEADRLSPLEELERLRHLEAIAHGDQ